MNFTNFSSRTSLDSCFQNFVKYVNIGVPTFLFLENITQKNYSIIFERVDKLSRKDIYLRKILDLDYEFRLRYILLDLDWKSYGQRFIITLIRYFPGFGFENNWTTNLDYNYFILRDLDFKYLDCCLSHWIWNSKYLDYDF